MATSRRGTIGETVGASVSSSLRGAGLVPVWLVFMLLVCAARPGYGTSVPSTVRINEILCSNTANEGLRDEDEEWHDWIEIYNGGSREVNLKGWSLTDDAGDPKRWIFPELTLGAGKYLIVFASGKNRYPAPTSGYCHTNFKLEIEGEYLGLYDSSGEVVSEIGPSYPEQRNVYSYGLDTNLRWRYFTRPTPKLSNGTSPVLGLLPRVRFDVEAGFFNQPFRLSLLGPSGSVIRYTLDGSAPTAEQGEIFKTPLEIGRTTVLRAAAFQSGYLSSTVVTRTYLFLEDVIRQPPNPPGFPMSTQWSSYGWMADYAMDPKTVNSRPDGISVQESLLSLPTLSIVCPIPDMFGEESGLYTHAIEDEERACSVELIHPDSRPGFQENCSIQMHGGGSRVRTMKHSFHLRFKKEYGPTTLKYPIFPDCPVKEHDTVILRADYNNHWTHGFDASQRARGQMIRDTWFKDMQLRMGGLSPHSSFVHLYINGLYWGVYNTSERPDGHFAATHLGGQPEDYDAFNGSSPSRPMDGDSTARQAMLKLDRLNEPAQYQAIQQYLNLTSYIDYLVLLYYGANQDWGRQKNWYSLRRREPGAGFSYICWDNERTLERINDLPPGIAEAALLNNISPDDLQAKLVQNPEYRRAFADRVQKHFFNGGALTLPVLTERWNRRAAEVDRAMVAESARWGDSVAKRPLSPPPYLSYHVNTPYNRHEDWLGEGGRLLTNYFPRRAEVYLGQLRTAGLFPSLAAPVFSHSAGLVAKDTEIKLSAPTGKIYYSTNGADVREAYSGAVSREARLYTSSTPIRLQQSTRIQARVFDGAQWSPLSEGLFWVNEITPLIKITEVMYHPPEGEAYEFVELFNAGSVPLDLGGYYLEGIQSVIPPAAMLAPGQTMILGSSLNPAWFKQRYPGVTVTAFFQGSLRNGGERLVLRNRLGEPITGFEYGNSSPWPAQADGLGYSLEMGDAWSKSSTPDQWIPSRKLGGSPGEIPPPLDPSIWINEVLAWNQSAVAQEDRFPDYVEIYNAGDRRRDISGWCLTDRADQRRFIFPANTQLEARQYAVVWCDDQYQAVGWHSGFKLDKDGETLFLLDDDGKRVDAFTFGAQAPNYSIARFRGKGWRLGVPTPSQSNQEASLAPPSQLVLNEWLARPQRGESSWIELFNRSSQAPIALEGLYFLCNGAVVPLPSASFLPPQGYARFKVGSLAPGSDLPDLEMASSNAVLKLADSSGTVLDSIHYGPQVAGISEGRMPDGGSRIVAFAAGASPGSSNQMLSQNSGLRINEVMARNNSLAVLQAGRICDWVELHNPTASSLELSGMAIGLNPGGSNRWTFPSGARLAAGGYLVVLCDGSRPASDTLETPLDMGQSLNADSGGVYLFSSSNQIQDSVEYGFQIQDQTFGRSQDQWHLLAQPTPGQANAAPASLGSPQQLRLNEWMANPASGNDWLELYNPETRPVLLSGLFLTDDPSMIGQTRFQVGPLSFISAGGWVEWEADGKPELGPNHLNFSLSAQGETVLLYGLQTNLIDQVQFAAQQAGVSEGRLPDGNSAIHRFSSTSSPGESNYQLLTNVVINEILAHTDPPLEDAIELYNPTDSAVDLSHYYLSNSEKELKRYRLPAGSILPAQGYFVFYQYQFQGGTGSLVPFTLNSARGDQVFLSATDGSGNLNGQRAQVSFGATLNGVAMGRIQTSTGVEFAALSQPTFGADRPANILEFRTGRGAANAPAKAGPIGISEIMYHVPDDPSTGQENTALEFIELHNWSHSNIPLYDPFTPSSTWRLEGGITFQFPTGIIMPPGSSLILVSFDPQVEAGLKTAFLNQYQLSADTALVGPYSGKLGNGGDRLDLVQPDRIQEFPHPDAGYVPQVRVERVTYADGAPWPATADGAGDSLQRKNPPAYSSDPASWTASAPNPGQYATPPALRLVIQSSSEPAKITVQVQGPPSPRIVLQTSTDMRSWSGLMTNSPFTGSLNQSLLRAVQPGSVFYRAVVE